MKNNPSRNNVVQSAARWRSCHAGMVGGAEMKQFEYVKVYIVMTDRGLVDHLRQPQLEEDKSVGRVLRVLPFKPNGPEVHSIMQEVFGTDLEFEDAMRASWVITREYKENIVLPEDNSVHEVWIQVYFDPDENKFGLAGTWDHNPTMAERRAVFAKMPFAPVSDVFIETCTHMMKEDLRRSDANQYAPSIYLTYLTIVQHCIEGPREDCVQYVPGRVKILQRYRQKTMWRSRF